MMPNAKNAPCHRMLLMSETSILDLANPDGRGTVARPEYKGPYFETSQEEEGEAGKGGRAAGTGLTFIRPAAVSRFSQIPLYFHGTCDP